MLLALSTAFVRSSPQPVAPRATIARPAPRAAARRRCRGTRPGDFMRLIPVAAAFGRGRDLALDTLDLRLHALHLGADAVGLLLGRREGSLSGGEASLHRLDRVADVIAVAVAAATGDCKTGTDTEHGDSQHRCNRCRSPCAGGETAGLLFHVPSPSPGAVGRRPASPRTLLMVVVGVDSATADAVVGVTA